ncbi:MAG: tetratricopeptide repeat protein, partial [Chloroflexi bacterium]|nr:tetratricopeptide repeat protein [Chloroflexota bacterium]
MPTSRQPTTGVELVFREATLQHQQGNTAEAERLYRAALDGNPKHVGALLAFALFCAERQRPSEAAALLSRALELNPNNAPSQQCIGTVLEALGRPELAIRHYQAALQLEPASGEARIGLANAHNNYGNTLHAAHRSEEAVAHFEEALRLKAEYPEAHSNLGNALRAVNRTDEAIAHYNQALQLRPGHAEALNNLGNTYLELHAYDKALECYQAALQSKPDYAVACSNLGIALQELDRWDEAGVFLERALTLDPTNVPAHQGIALLRFREGREEEVQRHAAVGFARRVESYPYLGASDPVRVLVLQSAFGGNMRTESWLYPAVYEKSIVTVDFYEPGLGLPPHDLIVNAVGEADRAEEALQSAARLLAGVSAPIVNPPERVLSTSRVANARRLNDLPDVVGPMTTLFPRASITIDALEKAGFGWPLLLRSPGFHTGENFVKIDRPDDLLAEVDGLPGAELLA